MIGGKYTDMVIAGALGVVGVAIVYSVVKLWKSKEEIIEAVNPSDDENLAYQGVNSVVQSATGDDDLTLGVFLYELFHDPWETE